MSVESKEPAIRFKGFSGEWKKSRLEELFLFKNGINASKEQYGKGLKFINVLDIINNRFITHNNIIGLVDVSIDVFEKNKVEYGDILFQRSSETREEVGQSNVYLDKEKNSTFGGFVIRGKKIGEYNPIFINFLLKTSNARKEITARSGGSTRYNVGQETLKRVLVYIPSEQIEQAKIGNYFQQLDTLIAQHQKKHDKLLNLKKALLEKMFPKQSAEVPEIRFKGFSGEWEERALGEVCSYHTSSLSVGDATIEGKYELYDANKVIGYTSHNIQRFDYITIIKDGAGVGRVRYLPRNTSFIGTMGAIQAKKSDINFIFCYLVKIDFSKYITGSTIPHIYFSNYGNADCKIPIIKEQTKIGKLFKHLDTLLNQHQSQLKKLKQIKKACLEKMFV